MGASSSTTASGVKGRRKISRVSAEEGQVEDPTARASRLMMQNGQLGTGGEWHTKAHSMYELQREKSTEAGGGGGLEEAEREHGNGNGNGNGNVQQNGMNSNNMNNNKELGTTKASPKRRKSNAAGKRDDLAMNSRQQSPRPVAGGGSLEGPTSPSSPSNSSAQPQKPTQRRRPLTWAWLRGHEVSLPGTGAAVLEPVGAARKPTAAAMAATRRRSLKVGTESSLAVSAANTEWGIQRQLSSSSANSAASTSAQPATTVPAHVPLVRRASQGRPLLAQLGRQKSIRKSDAGLASQHNPISASGREIIQFCFDQPHNEIGVRICSRLLEKRPDFRSFVYTMGKERWLQMTARLKDFLETVVRRVDNIDIVERVARKYGEEHVELKAFGFKPDFWVSLADAITVECVILDQATHQPSDTITAWSLLVSIMFSAVRDGYYQAMRAQRISQRHKNVHQREQALRVVDGGATSPAPSSAGTGGGGGGGSGVEKSASANELQSPGKKGAGTAFRFGDSGLISEEAEGRKCSREEKKDQQPSKKSNKTVEFF